MLGFILRRIAYSLVGLAGVVIITFFLSHILPGDPAQLAAGGMRARPEAVEAVRKQMGLDQPIPVQFGRYLAGLARGDLGRSIRTKQPVNKDLRRFMPATVELSVVAMLIVALLGIPFGVLAAVRRDGLIDQVIRVVSISAVSLPVFWFALLAQMLFYRQLQWLPVGNRLPLFADAPPGVTGLFLVDSVLAWDWLTFRDALLHLTLPAVVLATGSLAMVTRMVRGSVLDVLNLDYVRTARAKGLTERIVIFKHVLRNALVPVVTMLGLQFGTLLSGAVLAEVVFNWPGIGLYAVQSIVELDYQPILGVTILIGVAYVTINLLVDILYAKLDPRIRFS
ncbi:MAG: dipeptide transport system permease protein dppB [Firmicutes bacterium]|nr:dipeptide transport system permease protein dppB [Bacillota bacterium]